ncbi:hypothetical protein F5J12DRAFT_897822 [Pisolithus orientalis]|uniref:uncharacterized protein n=1 Tax=Pisolithus orientalis TaxID=936130 RepID=UPI002224762A|nr:uncharacterized protein F5J12DRAFT_897822 [Pisolithus orientalis]KAI5989778.1 hypothetical protein F5J12DRAFT_897822 [Pisolithus orientalis]
MSGDLEKHEKLLGKSLSLISHYSKLQGSSGDLGNPWLLGWNHYFCDEDIVMEDGATLPPGWNDPGPSIHMSTYSASRSTSGSPASCAGAGPSRLSPLTHDGCTYWPSRPSSSAGRSAVISRSPSAMGDMESRVSSSPSAFSFASPYPFHSQGSTSKDTPLDILYIPDPSREVKSKNEAKEDLGWATRCIKPHQYEVIKELGKFVYKLSESKEGVKVVVSEWLWLAMNMEEYNDGNAFELKYMKWADFKAIVLDPISQQSKWNELVRMDCIIGGIDYTIDFRRQVQFWPPPDQVRTAAVKWETLAHLQAISAIHRWVVPEMHIISDGDPIDDSYVLKRSHSDCGKHVILPTAPKSSRTWAHLKNNTNEDSDEVWIAQQYIPSLVFLGEWRLNNGGWSGIPVTSFLSLEEAGEIWYDALSSCLSYLELDLANRKDESLSIAEQRKKIVNPQRGDIETRQRAMDEFNNFVLKAWAELVARETEGRWRKTFHVIVLSNGYQDHGPRWHEPEATAGILCQRGGTYSDDELLAILEHKQHREESWQTHSQSCSRNGSDRITNVYCIA